MDLAVVLTTFVVIFPAELPDRSLFASLVLGTRFRPLPVFCGVAAFAVRVVIAVSVGGMFSLCGRWPRWPWPWATAWCGASRPASSAG